MRDAHRPRTTALVALASALAASASEADPMAKTIQLIDSLAVKVQSDWESQQKAYHDYFEWCDETSHEKQFEIKSTTAKKEKLESIIEKADSDMEASGAKINELASKIKTDTEDLQAATKIREEERGEFEASEAELMGAGDTLGRAIGVIEKEMAKNPAAFAQIDTSGLNGLINGLGAILDAASFANQDRGKLMALVQSQQDANDDAAGAPAADAYKSHSSGIVDVLEDMKDKAEQQLTALRQGEVTNRHNYDMLKQGLQDAIDADSKALKDEKADLADTTESKAVAEKDLVLTTKALDTVTTSLAAVQEDCMKTASDHEVSDKARQEELKVLGEVKKILMETTKGASEATYSFLEVGSGSRRASSRQETKKQEVTRLVKKLAKDQHSAALSQLSSRIAAILQFGAAAGDDPFEKVKGLITDMIAKLEKEAEEAATEKAYCDEEMSKTEAKKEELEDDKAKLTAKIDTKVAQSADLKKQVTLLQTELATLAKETVAAANVRKEQNDAYTKTKAELETGLLGVRKALKVLREYYGNKERALLQLEGDSSDEQPPKPVSHAKASGAGGSIMAILEVCESDMAKTLAAVEAEESDSAEAYEQETQETKKIVAQKSQDVKYKTQEFKGLDGAVNGLEEGRDSTDEELSAVLEYYGKVKQMCVAKPETYEERAKRREVEIKGLKEALDTLGSETAFVQVESRHRRNRRGEFMGVSSL